MIQFTRKRVVAVGTTLAVVIILATAPMALGALGGSGNINDIVQLSVTTGTLSSLTASASGGSASASPVTSGGTAFHVTNSGSNLDTFIRYDWSTSPYYSADTSKTSVTIRGSTYYISDLLWFKQETVSAAPTTNTSEYFSPLILKNAATITTATFTSAGNACTGWTGTPDASFAAATAAGTITFKYHTAASPVDDTPTTSDTFQYCLDTTNSLLYLGTTTVYGSGTLLQIYSANSANAVLKTYQYEFRSGGQTEGNSYCFTAVTGAGTTATPDLAQCEILPFALAGTTSAKVYALFDPPAYFPASNQGGALTYSLTGTQWNPYASGTSNTA